MTGKSALEYFTDDVLSGRTREKSLTELYNVFFRAPADEESWDLLKAWARANGIGLTTESREMRPRKRETWVMFSPHPR